MSQHRGEPIDPYPPGHPECGCRWRGTHAFVNGDRCARCGRTGHDIALTGDARCHGSGSGLAYAVDYNGPEFVAMCRPIIDRLCEHGIGCETALATLERIICERDALKSGGGSVSKSMRVTTGNGTTYVSDGRDVRVYRRGATEVPGLEIIQIEHADLRDVMAPLIHAAGGVRVAVDGKHLRTIEVAPVPDRRAWLLEFCDYLSGNDNIPGDEESWGLWVDAFLGRQE